MGERKGPFYIFIKEKGIYKIWEIFEYLDMCKIFSIPAAIMINDDTR